jgi:ERCC4-type nuclease
MKRVGITRKSASDLLGSIGERFSAQLDAMLDYYDICIILIEGSIKWDRGTGVIVSQYKLQQQVMEGVRNYLTRWQMRGFIRETTVDVYDTVNRLNELYAYFQKPYSLSAKSRHWTDDRILALPSGCRGATGMKLLDGRCLRDIGNMSMAELMNVDGIGSKKGTLIFEHFSKVKHTEGNKS